MKNKQLLKVVGLLIIMILFCLGIYMYSNQKQEYSKNIYYMDTYINVKIYSNNKVKADNILGDVEQIYKEYHELTDRYNHYDGIINVYDIHNNNLDDEYLTLNSKLYEILEFSNNWNEKYHKLNIEIGNVIDVWKSYRDKQNGVPTIEELQLNNNHINLVLLGDNKILNNHPNLDLGSIAKGYATEEVGKYLESIGVEEYLINAGGNVKAGKTYKKENYKIGVQSPVKEELLIIINGSNISVVTSGGYERNYEYDGKFYHHIIDPDTLMPSNNMKSVTVVTKDSRLGDTLSTTLFLMSVEEGQEFIKEYDVEAIWYTNDDKIIRSENFSNYE